MNLQVPPHVMMQQLQQFQQQIEREKLELEKLKEEVMSQNQLYGFAGNIFVNLLKDWGEHTDEYLSKVAIEKAKKFREICKEDAKCI